MQSKQRIEEIVKEYAKDDFDKKILKLQLESLVAVAQKEQIQELRKRK
jgi:hypothetical protein